MKFSDGTEVQVCIGTASQKIELLKYRLDNGEPGERVIPPMTRSEFKTFIDELSQSYEKTQWNVEQGHITE